MKRIAEIIAHIKANKNVIISFGDKLEVSLDCSDCERRRRTVVFELDSEAGNCTPTGHSFRGKLAIKNTWQADRIYSAKYEVVYEYEPFVDRKYPNEPNYYGQSKGVPIWGRVHFPITCPQCERWFDWSMQNNIVRPWTNECKCGYELYTEIEEMPILSWHEATPEEIESNAI